MYLLISDDLILMNIKNDAKPGTRILEYNSLELRTTGYQKSKAEDK